jgi:hypothetical protein
MKSQYCSVCIELCGVTGDDNYVIDKNYLCGKCFMENHTQKCCNCGALEYNDADFTLEEKKNYRCSFCEKKLYEEAKRRHLMDLKCCECGRFEAPEVRFEEKKYTCEKCTEKFFEKKKIDIQEVEELMEPYCLGFYLANAVEYILRAPHESHYVDDLKESIWHIQKEIENYEAKNQLDSTLPCQ